MSLIERMLRGTDKRVIIEVLTKLCQEDKDIMLRVLGAIAESHEPEGDSRQTDIEDYTHES